MFWNQKRPNSKFDQCFCLKSLSKITGNLHYVECSTTVLTWYRINKADCLHFAQAPETLGGRSGQGGPGEGLFEPSCPPLSKNQADSVCHCRHPCHDSSFYWPGNFLYILNMSSTSASSISHCRLLWSFP